MDTMPALFVGHGSPMNAIEKNEYTQNWRSVGEKLPIPQAILSISAHWFTNGTKICDAQQPKMIYDMYGFPDALYQLIYPAKGSPAFAHQTQALVSDAQIDNSWGLDHGTWSVLCHLFPKADIPVYQMSVNALATPQEQYEMGKALQNLRKEGVMIFGSGNVVHNLRLVNWDMQGGYGWADEFDGYIKNAVQAGRYQEAVQFEKAGSAAKMAVPTPDHYAPLLYVLGASTEKDHLTVFNDSCLMGSLSMTSYLFA